VPLCIYANWLVSNRGAAIGDGREPIINRARGGGPPGKSSVCYQPLPCDYCGCTKCCGDAVKRAGIVRPARMLVACRVEFAGLIPRPSGTGPGWCWRAAFAIAISAARGLGEQANARITFESSVDEVSSPRIEAGLSRPQRDILTARR